MGYRKRLSKAFTNAPVLNWNVSSKYVFFSDLHRGIGNNNDNFLKNSDNFLAALQYYKQYGFTYVEVGDGDELWENKSMEPIIEAHNDIFEQFCDFHKNERLYMLYGNHDMKKRKIPYMCKSIPFYEGLILHSQRPAAQLLVTHGHQADFLNSVFWRLAKSLVRHLWTPLEAFGILDPTSASQNPKKKGSVERNLIHYAKSQGCRILTGHTHRPFLGNTESPYYNCGSCVHTKYITCIELCGYHISLVKWYSTTERNRNFGNIYTSCPPSFPVYIKREVLDENTLSGTID